MLKALSAGTGFAGQGQADAFVRDIRGEAVEPHPTFREGSRYQQIIDIIRRSDNWTDISARD